MESMILPYRRYFDFKGRSARKEYWMFILLWVIVYVAFFTMLFTGIDVSGRGGQSNDGVLMIAMSAIVLFFVASFIPLIAVQVRRFHDQDRSGWFFLLNFIPSVGGLVVLVFMCIEGTEGPNRFGDDPRDPTAANVFV